VVADPRTSHTLLRRVDAANIYLVGRDACDVGLEGIAFYTGRALQLFAFANGMRDKCEKNYPSERAAPVGDGVGCGCVCGAGWSAQLCGDREMGLRPAGVGAGPARDRPARPSESTFRRVLQTVDAHAMDTAVLSWLVERSVGEHQANQTV
jgi:hypothetical protein